MALDNGLLAVMKMNRLRERLLTIFLMQLVNVESAATG